MPDYVHMLNSLNHSKQVAQEGDQEGQMLQWHVKLGMAAYICPNYVFKPSQDT